VGPTSHDTSEKYGSGSEFPVLNAPTVLEIVKHVQNENKCKIDNSNELGANVNVDLKIIWFLVVHTTQRNATSKQPQKILSNRGNLVQVDQNSDREVRGN
jgi:hypothetical protein